MNEQQFENAVARMVQGDKTGLKEIYLNYAGYIYRIIYEVLQNKENAEDVTSEFFIRLWDKAEQFKPGNGHKAIWLLLPETWRLIFYESIKKKSFLPFYRIWDKKGRKIIRGA